MHNTALGNEIKYAKSEGYTFVLNEEIWILSKEVKINFGILNKISKGSLDFYFVKTFSFFAENYSAEYVNALFYGVRTYLSFNPESKDYFTSSNLINYRASLKTKNIWHLGMIRIFFNKWYGLGYPGISKEIVDLLDGWRIKGNIKGDAIKRKDPKHGPLSDVELSAFNEKVVQAYERNKINKTELVVSLLLSHTGRRPVQISYLKNQDVVSSLNKKGERVYFINVPRVKQRGEFRDELKLFALKEDVWNLIGLLAEENIKEFRSNLKIELSKDDLNKFPLFPNWTEVFKVKDKSDFIYLLDTDRFHIQNKQIDRIVKKVVNQEKIYSERTGELLNLSPRRFRYTIGTRAAKEGFGELIIAELLDHSDTQNAGVYVRNVPEHVSRLDEAIGFQLAPYAQAFAGKLVDRESDSIRGNDRNSRIRTEDGNPVGNCGDFGFCGANVPIPCYTCIHFQPWVDGPHKEVYESLISERERIEQITGDIAVTEVLDRSILAVAEVILKCEVRNKEIINNKDSNEGIVNE
ncbi:site-specific integrase [Serratia symbiotica]|uniref:site-specific integrase n=1 Tax=Serratia symbiotica TaxID=138074 RepID=UPI0013250FAA|nr:site-specific integrase [Serratia symbiotica]QTP14803.1 recombinase [Serratia symbiotica]